MGTMHHGCSLGCLESGGAQNVGTKDQNAKHLMHMTLPQLQASTGFVQSTCHALVFMYRQPAYIKNGPVHHRNFVEQFSITPSEK